MPTSAPEPLLDRCSSQRPVGRLRQDRRAARHRPHGRRRRDRGPARPQRRRQDARCCKAISGLLPRTGSIRFAGQDMSRRRSARGGAMPGWCTSSKAIACSPSSAVFDNLLLAGYGMKRDERATQVEEALAFFPEIAEKRQRPRRDAVGRPAADAGGGAGPGAPAASPDAGRAVGRPVAGAGRSRAGRRRAAARRPAPPCCWSSS